MFPLATGRRVIQLYSQTVLYGYIVTSLLLSLVSVTYGSNAAWVSQPSDQKVLVGNTARFVCEATGLTSANQYVWIKGVSALFINGVRNTGVSNRYQIEGTNTLVINNVELSDDDFFSCNVFAFDQVQVKLTVLLPPGPPSIETNSSSFIEDSVINFSCSSSGGKPSPSIEWLRNGQQLNSATLVPPSQEMGTTSSHITVTLRRDDHSANYTCVVYNEANQDSPKTSSKILNVQYSPSITFSPVFNPYHVKINKQVRITCEIDANPVASSVTWHRHRPGSNPESISSGRILLFNTIKKDDSGNYSCTAINTINGEQRKAVSSMIIDVIYPPIVSTAGIITVNVSQQVNLSCKVDANPPATEVRWEKDDNTFSVNQANYIFTAERHHHGNYSCTAKARLEPSGLPAEDISSKRNTIINVQYKPGVASISPISSVIVGQQFELSCNVDDPGNPPPNYEWRRSGDSLILQSTSSPVYRVTNAKLADNGNYTCTPRNLMGQGAPATITVEVNSPPIFVQSNPPGSQLTVPISQSNLMLEHKIEGRPKPQVQWYKDNVPLTMLGGLYRVDTTHIVVEQYKFLVTTRLMFTGSEREQNRLMIDDNANFTCQVMSSAANSPRVKATQLSVEFVPIVLMVKRVAVSVTETAVITCQTQSNPNPAVSWFRGSVRLTNNSRMTMNLQKSSGFSQFEATLTIRDVANKDFGQYTCEVSNLKGVARKNVLLSPKSKPEAPDNLSAAGKTWESVLLKWDPGFEGGYTQMFIIAIRSVHGEEIRKVFPVYASAFNVTRLMPQTSYTFHVYGENQLGKGENSEGFTAQTEALVFPPLKEIPEYKVEDQQLKIPNDLNQSFCIRVEVSSDNGKVWSVVEPCITAAEGSVSLGVQSATNVNVSVCLVYRPEVCGEPVVSSIHQPSTPDLTETEVIIIGCVCAGILIVLLIILICIICKRRQRNKNYSNDPHSPRTIQQGNGTLPNQYVRGYDNKDIHVNRNGYPPQYLVTGENFPMGDTSYDSHTLDKHYEYEMNRRNANNTGENYHNDKNYQGDLSFSGSPRTPTKDPQQFINVPEDHKNEGGSFGSGQESGYSTPDPAKPKKTWSLRPSFFNFQHNTLRPTKNKNMKTNPDFVPYSHDPPGHTCGLPCCSEDLQIQLRVSRQPKSCIGIQENDVIQQNFTFGRQANKLRPILENGFFSVQQPRDVNRAPIPKFGSMRGGFDHIDVMPYHHEKFFPSLKTREITLPEMKDPKATEKLYLQDFAAGESDDLNIEPDEIEYYMTSNQGRTGVHYNPSDLTWNNNVIPLNLYRDAHTYQKTDGSEDSASSNYYEVLSYPEEPLPNNNAAVATAVNTCQSSAMMSPADKLSSPKKPFNLPLPLPPKLPVQNIQNHPPLPKSFNSATSQFVPPSSDVTGDLSYQDVLCHNSQPYNDIIFQKSQSLPAASRYQPQLFHPNHFNQSQILSDSTDNISDRSNSVTKYNTYNSVYSINSMANQRSRDAYERYMSINRANIGRKMISHRDIRDLDFTGQDVPMWKKHVGISSLTKAKLDKLLKKNEDIADKLRSNIRNMGRNSLNHRSLSGRPSFILEDDEEEDEEELAIDNHGFKHVDIDGKIWEPEHTHVQNSSADLVKQIKNMELGEVSGPQYAQSNNPVTLIL